MQVSEPGVEPVAQQAYQHMDHLRAQEAAQYQAQQAECYTRFAVNGCLRDAHSRHRAVLADLQRQQKALHEQDRLYRSAQVLQRTRQKAQEHQEKQQQAAQAGSSAAEKMQAQQDRQAAHAEQVAQAHRPNRTLRQSHPSHPNPGQPFLGTPSGQGFQPANCRPASRKPRCLPTQTPASRDPAPGSGQAPGREKTRSGFALAGLE